MASEIAMEQVPLKSDTDKPAENETTHTETTVTETTTDTESTPVKGKSGFGRFFHREKKEKIVEGKEGEETEAKEGETKETNTEEIIPKEPKKPIWPKWFERKPKEPKVPKDDVEGADGGEPQFGLDMIDRDAHNLNEHIKLSFEDILAEPDTNHSWDCSWRLTHRIFTCTRQFFYKLLALILAIPCAIIWGFVFALLAIVNVWACVPFGRALTIPAIWIAKAWNFIVRSLFDPLFRSCGLCLASVNIRRYGISNDHTQEMA